jgi:hypothetical protein
MSPSIRCGGSPASAASLAPGRSLVDHLGHEGAPGPCLPLQEHGGLGGGGAADDLLGRRTLGPGAHVAQAGPGLVPEHARLPAEAALLEGALHDGRCAHRVVGEHHERVGAIPQGLDGPGDVLPPAGHDEGGVGAARPGEGDDRRAAPSAGAGRADDALNGRGPEDLDGALGRGGLDDLVPLEAELARELAPHGRVGVEDQDPFGRHRAESSASRAPLGIPAESVRMAQRLRFDLIPIHWGAPIGGELQTRRGFPSDGEPLARVDRRLPSGA